MLKLIKYFIIFLGIQIVFLAMLMLDFSIIKIGTIILNAFLSFIVIKQIEKRYYKKYNRLASMLYNLCPLIGITTLMLVLNRYLGTDYILYLKNYYITLFIIIYIINLLYLLICTIRHS